jgi:hypothetical protein
LPTSGNYRVGIRAIHHEAGINTYSDYVWSNIEGTPEPWYASYNVPAGKVLRLRVK